MKEAAERVVSRQMSPCQAAATFGVAKTTVTLFRYVTKMKSADDIRSVPFPKAGARKSNSSGCQEQERPEY